MSKMINIAGRKFGKLTAVRPTLLRESSNGVVKWLCRCDCGKFHVVNGSELRRGNIHSCGCIRRRTIQ